MSDRSDMPIIVPAPSQGEATGGVQSAGRKFDIPLLQLGVEVYDLHSQTRVTGRCSDLGPGGCYVDTLSPLVAGTVVRIRIERDMCEFEATALIAFAQAPMGMGLSFQEINPASEAILRSWIAELSGEKSPKLEVAYGSDRRLGTAIRSRTCGKSLNEFDQFDGPQENDHGK